MDAEVLSLMVTAVATLKEFLQDTHYRSQPLSGTWISIVLLNHVESVDSPKV